MLKFLFRDNDVDVVVVQDGEENGAPGGGFNQAEDNSQVEFHYHADAHADTVTDADADSVTDAETVTDDADSDIQSPMLN